MSIELFGVENADPEQLSSYVWKRLRGEELIPALNSRALEEPEDFLIQTALSSDAFSGRLAAALFSNLDRIGNELVRFEYGWPDNPKTDIQLASIAHVVDRLQYNSLCPVLARLFPLQQILEPSTPTLGQMQVLKTIAVLSPELFSSFWTQILVDGAKSLSGLAFYGYVASSINKKIALEQLPLLTSAAGNIPFASIIWDLAHLDGVGYDGLGRAMLYLKGYERNLVVTALRESGATPQDMLMFEASVPAEDAGDPQGLVELEEDLTQKPSWNCCYA